MFVTAYARNNFTSSGSRSNIKCGWYEYYITEWNIMQPLNVTGFFFLSFSFFSFGFSRQGFFVALEPVPELELALADQAGLKLTEIRLPLPPECWD